MLQIIAIVELSVSWFFWGLAFWKPRKLAAGQKKVISAPASRWGIGLEVVAFALTWMYIRPVGFEKSTVSLLISMILFPPAVLLVWAATRHLGKQWRYEAALSEDHELIQTGPYAFVRHPIYTSMLCMLLATGAAWSWWPLFTAGVIFFLAGNEIRVRAEDRLLSERFGASFQAYRSRVSAYIPFIR
jgi:protein-S-isoprenylcysteine O-methyltransferase Ste14